MMGESDLLFKAGGQIGGEPGVPDGVGVKRGELAAVLGDAADFVHHLQGDVNILLATRFCMIFKASKNTRILRSILCFVFHGRQHKLKVKTPFKTLRLLWSGF